MSAREPEQAPHQVVFSRRHMLVGASMLVAAAAAQAAIPQPVHPVIDNKRFDRWVPRSFGKWRLAETSGVLLPPPDALSDRLYDNLVTRVYESPKTTPVMLLIAYNNVQNGVLQVHRPEVCYPAGGYALSPTVPRSLALAVGQEVPANAFSAFGSDRIEQVMYFTRLGPFFPRSWLDQRISVMRSNFAGEIPDGAMLRLSVYDSNFAAAMSVMSGFVIDFFKAAPKPLWQMLAGRAGPGAA